MSSVYSQAEYLASLPRQVEIPTTTPERYITGLYALNLATPEGTSGDWHDVFHWQDGTEQPRQVTLAGMGDIETSPIYGDLGIYEGRDRLVAQGLDIPASMQRVYIANHSRAILDLLYRSLNRWGRVLNLTGATTDWLDTREQGERLLEQATLLETSFHPAAQEALRCWIADEARTLRAVYG
ncbi:hypothetical protein [Actinomyces naeslundii]|uniref:hypothetical protein n=1 Tax=Actinomyces naeslundii TaxID=1655 RepID=UPI00094C90E6|nr:hypothetical protein [Actinomyces naeslundii]OLO87561.1 hypothetical protein BKH11_05955 [Actinomyces naeslundii]OMG14424.1 hypothetical protein BKH08_02410 [Actinomyces naeslundii]